MRGSRAGAASNVPKMKTLLVAGGLVSHRSTRRLRPGTWVRRQFELLAQPHLGARKLAAIARPDVQRSGKLGRRGRERGTADGLRTRLMKIPLDCEIRWMPLDDAMREAIRRLALRMEWLT